MAMCTLYKVCTLCGNLALASNSAMRGPSCDTRLFGPSDRNGIQPAVGEMSRRCASGLGTPEFKSSGARLLA